MSILDRGYETVTVFLDEEYLDEDGIKHLRTSTTGIECVATIQPASSGTQRSSEQSNEGYETEEIYRIRFRRNDPIRPGIWAKVVWRGQTWTIHGHPLEYSQGSKRMPHRWYMLTRF